MLACFFCSVGWAPASILLTCDLRRGAGRHFSRAGAALGTPAVDWRVPFLLSTLLRQRLVRWALKTTTAGAARTGSLLPPRGSPWGPYYLTVEAGAMLLVACAATVATRISGLWSTGAWTQGGLASGDEGPAMPAPPLDAGASPGAEFSLVRSPGESGQLQALRSGSSLQRSRLTRLGAGRRGIEPPQSSPASRPLLENRAHSTVASSPTPGLRSPVAGSPLLLESQF